MYQTLDFEMKILHNCLHASPAGPDITSLWRNTRLSKVKLHLESSGISKQKERIHSLERTYSLKMVGFQ